MNETSESAIFDRLKRLAESDALDADTAGDLELATWALHFIQLKDHAKAFRAFIDDMNAPLSGAQIAQLKSMGLDL